MASSLSESISGERGAVQFPTRVDNWLVAVLVFAFIVSVASVLVSAMQDPRGATVAGVVVFGAFAMVAALALPTHYTLEQRELVIRSGLLRYRIPLDSIRRVYPTRNPLSAPAWSLDRLGIEYRKKRGWSLALISPDQREEFMRLLGARAGLERQGEELRRWGAG